MKNIFLKVSLFALIFMVSCSKETVQPTREYYSVTKPTILQGFSFGTELISTYYRGYIEDIGTIGINKVGVCYGQTENPTLRDNVVFAENANLKKLPIIFDVLVEKLQKNTIYQARNFVITEKDTIYSFNNFFKTPNVHEFANRDITPVAGKSVFAENKLKDVFQESLTFFNENDTYFCYKADNYFYKYEPKFYNWQPIADLPMSSSYENKFCFMVNNTAYCGVVNKQKEVSFFKYQANTNTWAAENNKPSLKTTSAISFSNKQNGFILNKNLEKGWDLLEFLPNINIWTNKGEILKNTEIQKLISNNDETFIITKEKEILKFENGEFKPFFSLENLLNNIIDYEAWYVKGKIFIQTSYDIIEINSQNLSINKFPSFDISARKIGAIQMKNKMFFGNVFGCRPNSGICGIATFEFMIE